VCGQRKRKRKKERKRKREREINFCVGMTQRESVLMNKLRRIGV
jgi:hypothetical protein